MKEIRHWEGVNIKKLYKYLPARSKRQIAPSEDPKSPLKRLIKKEPMLMFIDLEEALIKRDLTCIQVPNIWSIYVWESNPWP